MLTVKLPVQQLSHPRVRLKSRSQIAASMRRPSWSWANGREWTMGWTSSTRNCAAACSALPENRHDPQSTHQVPVHITAGHCDLWSVIANLPCCAQLLCSARADSLASNQPVGNRLKHLVLLWGGWNSRRAGILFMAVLFCKTKWKKCLHLCGLECRRCHQCAGVWQSQLWLHPMWACVPLAPCEHRGRALSLGRCRS